MAKSFVSTAGGAPTRRPRIPESGAAALALLLTPAMASAAEHVADGAASPLAAAVLPSSRSVEVGNWATVFATMVNGGSAALSGCNVAPATSVSADFTYQTTDATTNALTGTPNSPASIGAGAAQSFVLSFKPTAAFDPTQIALTFACMNTTPAATSMPGLNTVMLSGSTTSRAGYRRAGRNGRKHRDGQSQRHVRRRPPLPLPP